MTLKIDIYSSFNSELETLWRNIEDNCEYFVFQSYEWLQHWQHTIGDTSYDIKPVVVVVSDSTRLLALFPLGIRKIGVVRVLEFLGGAQTDYNAPLILPEFFTCSQLIALWDAVLEMLPVHDVRYFVRTPHKVSNLPNPILGQATPYCDGVSYAATLPNSWELFRQRLPKRFQKDNARMIRRLSEKGDYQFKIANTAAEFNTIVEVMLKQKARRYKETGARNILADMNTCTFYRELETAIGNDVNIHMSALILNGEILATHLGAYDKNRFYYLFPTFKDGMWSKFSPGRLLLENLVKWAITKQIRTFDFTIGGESYKDVWCDSEMSLYRFVKPITFRGNVYARIQALINWVKTNRRARALAMRVVRMLNTLKY